MVEIGLVLLLLVGSYLIYTNPSDAFWWYELGRRFGYIGLIFYLLTLIPGILSRLRWLPLVGVMITPFRRHLGILMFACAFLHQAFTTVVPSFVFNVPINLTISTMNPRIFGVLALVVLFPLWLTSNDQSQKYLGKNWKLLHRLTYIALLLIFLHVAFFRKRWAIPTGTILLLEAYSWFNVWWLNRQKANPPPAQ